MSLKTFHVVFIIVSTVFSLGFSLWAIGDYRKTGEVASLVVGILSLVGAGVLVVYGKWFLNKLSRISWL